MADVEPTPVNKLVVIQDGTLVSMANSDAYVREFPFLRSLRSPAKARAGCGTCGGTANKVMAETFAAAKRTIAGLPSGKKQVLKRLLNTRQARVLYRDAAGRSVQLTF